LSPDRGSIIVADLALGAMIVLVLAAGASAAGMVIDAGQASREAARSAAVELARGVKVNPAMRRAESLAPADADVDHDVTNGSVRVVVRTTVRLPHPIFLSKRVSLIAEAVVPIAPYRSGG
jgi:hypothetical protein